MLLGRVGAAGLRCLQGVLQLLSALRRLQDRRHQERPLVLALLMVSGGLFVNSASLPAFFVLLNHANVFTYGFASLPTGRKYTFL